MKTNRPLPRIARISRNEQANACQFVAGFFLAALLAGCTAATPLPPIVATQPPSPSAPPIATGTAAPTIAATATKPAPTESPTPPPTATKRPFPRVQNTAVFGASAGLVWNFITLEAGVMQFQTQADPEAFTEEPSPVENDGDGIARVVFVVSAPNGDSIAVEDDAAPYCLPRGDESCEGFAVEGEAFVWPGGLAVQSGEHSVAITIELLDGQTRDLFGSFSLALP
jgi:hypothetical protein